MNNGKLGEIAAAKYFLENGWSVFLPIDGNESFDLAVYKANVFKRVSVKSTSRKVQNRWVFNLRQNRHKRQTNFNAGDSDFLCLYIVPKDKILVMYSHEVSGRCQLSVKEIHGENC